MPTEDGQPSRQARTTPSEPAPVNWEAIQSSLKKIFGQYTPARAASALNRPNIITIYDTSEARGVAYIAIQCVTGRPLAQSISGKSLLLPERLEYAIQIADALAKAHSAGIVHRAMKATNTTVNKVGVISDAHGLLRAAAISRLQGVDHIIHAGDIGSSESISILQSSRTPNTP